MDSARPKVHQEKWTGRLCARAPPILATLFGSARMYWLVWFRLDIFGSATCTLDRANDILLSYRYCQLRDLLFDNRLHGSRVRSLCCFCDGGKRLCTRLPGWNCGDVLDPDVLQHRPERLPSRICEHYTRMLIFPRHYSYIYLLLERTADSQG